MKSLDENIEAVYSGYFSLGKAAYQEKIRFYERHLKNISLLSFKENLEIEIDYSCALFHVQEHYQFLNRIDRLIRLVIEENIFVYDGVDIYKDLLFKKAEALTSVLDYYQAHHILNELAKMDHGNEAIRQAYFRNKTEMLRYAGQQSRTISIGLLFVAGIIIGVEVLYIRTFRPEWKDQTELLRNLILFAGVLNMVLKEAWIRMKTKSDYSKIK